ncbi:hypothetical protein NL364_28605, partial [Klebsiella pneumoniae]|nr:hypothetical protein [Klebsiella pneumoniae]
SRQHPDPRLSTMPDLLAVEGTGPLDIVALDDVASTVASFLRPGGVGWVVLDLVGPEHPSFVDVIRAYRAWLGCLSDSRLPASASR